MLNWNVRIDIFIRLLRSLFSLMGLTFTAIMFLHLPVRGSMGRFLIMPPSL